MLNHLGVVLIEFIYMREVIQLYEDRRRTKWDTGRDRINTKDTGTSRYLEQAFPPWIRQMESSRFQRSRKEWATIASISNNYLDVLMWLTGSRIHSTIVEHEGRNLREDGGDCLKIILCQRRTLTFERFRYENTLLWNQHFSSYVILHHREFVEQQDMVFKRVHEKIAIQGCIIKWISDRCLWRFDVRSLLFQSIALEKPNKELQRMECLNRSYVHSFLFDVGRRSLQYN